MKFSKEELSKLRVKDLRGLIRQHNLHNAIRRYSVMRKHELVEQLVKHKGGHMIKIKKRVTEHAEDHHHHHESPPASPQHQTPPKRTAKKASPKEVEVVKKPKRAKKSSKPKQMEFDKAFGLHKPLFSKEEGGLIEGARRQFEKRWIDETKGDAEFLKKLHKKIHLQDEKKKRKRVAKKSDAYEYPSLKVKDKYGKGRRKKIPNKKYA